MRSPRQIAREALLEADEYDYGSAYHTLLLADALVEIRDQEPVHRILRVIEYVGTADFVRNSIDKRGVKGSYRLKDGVIREGLIGETAEVIEMPEDEGRVCEIV